VSRRPGPAHLYRRILATIRAHGWSLVIVAAAVFIPISLIEAVGERVLEVDVEELTTLEAGGVAATAVVQVATSLGGEVFYAGAVAAVIVGSRTGVHRPLREVARELPYLRLLGVDLLYTLGAALLFLLLIVPGVVFFTYFALTAPVVEIEDRGIRAGFRRSRELVRGRFWTVLVILLPIAIVIELLTEADQALVNELLGHTLLADWLGTTIVNVVLNPVYAVAAVVLTIELIEAKGEHLPGHSPASE
jgi:hypothetical protein